MLIIADTPKIVLFEPIFWGKKEEKEEGVEVIIIVIGGLATIVKPLYNLPLLQQSFLTF